MLKKLCRSAAFLTPPFYLFLVAFSGKLWWPAKLDALELTQMLLWLAFNVWGFAMAFDDGFRAALRWAAS
jgi:hypothetical protein